MAITLATESTKGLRIEAQQMVAVFVCFSDPQFADDTAFGKKGASPPNMTATDFSQLGIGEC